MMKRLHDRVREEVPRSDGFWKSYTEETFVDAAETLFNLGMEPDDIIDLLGSLYSAVAEEYGD